MIRGVGASRAGMAIEQSRSEVIANNIANLNTDGFKRSVAQGTEFAQMLLQRLGDQPAGGEKAPQVGRIGHGAVLEEVTADLTQGDVGQVENPYAVALFGAGEFTYLEPAGLGYTRNGNFRLDGTGRLVTEQGHPVLVNGAPVGGPGLSIKFDADGTVFVADQPVGQLDIRGRGADTQVMPGYIERSNVVLAQEMTDMTMALRSFQVNQRAMQMQDQTLAKVVSEVGKL